MVSGICCRDGLFIHVPSLPAGGANPIPLFIFLPMDEDRIFEHVLEELKSCKDELRENRVYSVCDKTGGQIDKARIKGRFIQGDKAHPSTNITITISDRVSLTIENSPIYIYGEYIKLSRNMTQTPLKIAKKLKCERSVSDFCAQVKSFFGARSVTFIPAGREDYDVMMLGGRPFLLEVRTPRANLEFCKMSLVLHEELSIINFNLVTKECKKAVFEGACDSEKVYNAFICTKNPIVFSHSYDLSQRTPLRVLHRRANMTRKKTIEILDTADRKVGEWIYYLVTLRASAGTYIKEFVNSDFGRTTPALGTPGNYCDLLDLDVVNVEKRDIGEYVVKKIELETLRPR
jgi:tRNA pseudouridine synthase 10